MLTHLDDENRPTMVDVATKPVTLRTARAGVRLLLPPEVKALIRDGEIAGPKGPVLQTAVVAGTMAVKRTHELIPFCHPLGLDGCRFDMGFDAAGDLAIECAVRVTGRTGVEMEALTGAAVAALTVYDMCKALSHAIVITDLRLLAKTGGKSDFGPPGP